MEAQVKKIVVNVENVEIKDQVNGEFVTVGTRLKVLGAAGSDGSRHSDQYRNAAGKLMTFEQYVEMFKNRFKFEVVEVIVYEWKPTGTGTFKRNEVKKFLA